MPIQPSSLAALAALACACALVGCAAPRKALVMVRVPDPSAKVPAAANSAVASTEAVPKVSHDDGLRTGDLLGLPHDTEYRATNPALPKTNVGAGAVIVNPPSAPKPKPPGKPEE